MSHDQKTCDLIIVSNPNPHGELVLQARKLTSIVGEILRKKSGKKIPFGISSHKEPRRIFFARRVFWENSEGQRVTGRGDTCKVSLPSNSNAN